MSSHSRPPAGFLLTWSGIGKYNKMSRYFLFSSYHNTKLQLSDKNISTHHRLIKTQIGHARDFTWYRGQRPSPARVILLHERVQIHARENLCSYATNPPHFRVRELLLCDILITRAGDGRWPRYQAKSLACPGCGTHTRLKLLYFLWSKSKVQAFCCCFSLYRTIQKGNQASGQIRACIGAYRVMQTLYSKEHTRASTIYASKRLVHVETHYDVTSIHETGLSLSLKWVLFTWLNKALRQISSIITETLIESLYQK